MDRRSNTVKGFVNFPVHGESWHCTYYDLTEDGKALYDSLKSLYGESAELHILTFLDT